MTTPKVTAPAMTSETVASHGRPEPLVIATAIVDRLNRWLKSVGATARSSQEFDLTGAIAGAIERDRQAGEAASFERCAKIAEKSESWNAAGQRIAAKLRAEADRILKEGTK